MCANFQTKSPQERYETVKQLHLCPNCLRGNHSIKQCLSQHTCKTCHAKHNSLLHFPTKQKLSNQAVQHDRQVPATPVTSKNHAISNENAKSSITPVTSLSSTTPSSSTVLLATAEAEVMDRWGSFQTVRLLIDPGSQSHIITEHCAHRLGLSYYKSTILMSGIGDTPTKSSGKVFLKVRPKGASEPTFATEAVVLQKICSDMPTQPIDTECFSHLSNIQLADPSFHVTRPIDLLIGGELFPQLLLPGKINGPTNVATALNTVFGWILMGKTISSAQSSSMVLSINHAVVSDSNLDTAVQKFWDIENITSKDNVYSTDDQRCEEIYQQTHKRDQDGRYIVNLPFQGEMPKFSGSYEVALRRFFHLEKRLKADPNLYEEYKSHINEYLQTGQMELVPPIECRSDKAYYIPHHPVFKQDSLTTKLRVVYDASAKDKNGISLNNTLLTGCKLQADIVSILLRFRLHPIVFTADVRQMYRQIIVNPEHRDFQRILFRFSTHHPIQEYRIGRVTFGVSSAPFLAIRTIHQLAEDERESFPLAANILRDGIYVDDVVTGCEDTETALVTQNQLIGIMSTGGFELRKWASNDPNVLAGVPEEHRATPNLSFDSDPHFIKILGLAWNSSQDVFMYQSNPVEKQCTKRNMLSELARIFDPIGFLTPITFMAKFLIQRLWLLGIPWDSVVPEDIQNTWDKYSRQLPNLSTLHIDRRITHDDVIEYQLHGYCDASESGYAAVIYLRCTTRDNKSHTQLVFAKSRVSPVKRMTLPRLELSAASLLADAMQYVINTYMQIIQIKKVYAWSDSMIVLWWINSPSSNFKVFVGNRISNIQRKIPNAVWGHVPSKQNPADCASRGLTPDELINHDLWWSGPSWLSADQQQWPTNKILPQNHDEALQEQRSSVVLSNMTSSEKPHILDQLLTNYSSLRKIQRIIIYWNRFIDHKIHKRSISAQITEIEMHDALLLLVKHIQKSSFQSEINQLKSGKNMPKYIKKLKPFLDNNNILRVGGRLSHSELNFETKHPALLPRNHRLTELIIQTVHNENFHPGLQTLQYLILQNFWILSPRRAIRHVISQCYRCFRAKPIALQPVMADLPRSRITQLKAFQVVGCDYAGPFNITLHRHRGNRTTKAYLCLFVCFATKALHLELASDMSSEAFLACLHRFIGRRGRCNIIHSDCGSNFKGCDNQLQNLMKNACTEERIQFKFNPPGAPHFGGLWEAGVKSVKTHLYRVVGSQILTYEEMNTLLIQIESILNSRPLCPLSSDPSDLSVLTPGHFLTLAPLTTIPTPDYTDAPINRLNRWQLIQRMQQDFWTRWHREYLCTLTQRSKWASNDSNTVEIGTVVLVKEDVTSPLHWRLGRIIELHLGRDGVPRSATLKTQTGQLVRPLVKLCPLPIS